MPIRSTLRRALAIGLLLSVSSVGLLAAPSAHGDQIGDLQARADQISQQMNDLQAQISADSGAVEAARYRSSQLDAQIAEARAKVDEARKSEAANRRALSRYVLQAYVSGGADQGDLASVLDTHGDQLGQRQGYMASAVGDRQQLVDDLQASQAVTKERTATLQQARQAAADAQSQAEAKQASAEQAAAKLSAVKGQLDGQLADLVAKKQAAQQRAAEARARAAAQAQAAAQARAAAAATAQPPAAVSVPEVAPLPATPSAPTKGDGSGGDAFVPPPDASVASAALGYAESKLGSPYVWGAAGPNAFDCSGLVVWAYGKAGLSIGRTTYSLETQGTVVPLSKIQPGDMVFYGGGDHMALYVGGGTVIHAPQTGDVVRYASLYMMPPTLVVRPTG